MDEAQKELFEQPQKVESMLWQPKEKGEWIEGILTQKIPRENKDVGARYYVDLFGKGTKMLWGSSILDDIMAAVPAGNYVKITYGGKVSMKTDPKKTLHLWEVESAKRKELKNQLH